MRVVIHRTQWGHSLFIDSALWGSADSVDALLDGAKDAGGRALLDVADLVHIPADGLLTATDLG